MRILLVGDYPDDPRLGSGKVYHKLREEFRRLGHECDVLLSPGLGPRPAAARLRWLVGPLLAERAVARAVRRGGPYDVVDAASAEGAVLGVRRRAGALGGAALVSRSHGLEHLNFRRMVEDHDAGLVSKPWHRRLWYPAARMSQVALAARLADRLLVLNDADRAFAVAHRWKPAERIDVIPHGVSSRFLDDAPPPDAPRGRGILFCGSWDMVKGVDYLVAAMTLLAADAEPPRLTVLGPGLPAAAVLGAFPEAVRPLVTVVPRADEEVVMRHYREHDLLVMSSTYEGFGMVVVEAMSQRLPVVGTTVGGAPALLAGDAGLLVPPRDPEAIGAAVRRLLRDPALRRRLGDAGHDRVREMSWTATAERTLECYRAAREMVGSR
ncbi:Glycosyltransferase involved in cell wall bisynthesis [bacterium JGI 053]|nr:Glycosyltransferase involved in cell wall bisynthesis [bacterium JGI 053]